MLTYFYVILKVFFEYDVNYELIVKMIMAKSLNKKSFQDRNHI